MNFAGNFADETLEALKDMVESLAQVKGKAYSLGIMVLVNHYTSIISMNPPAQAKTEEKIKSMACLTSQLMIANITLVAQLLETEDAFEANPIRYVDEVEKNFRMIVTKMYPEHQPK